MIIAQKDNHTAYLENNKIIIRNPRGIIGEFDKTGEVCGIWRPQSRWEQDTAKALALLAVQEITKAYLCIDGFAGRREYPVEIVKETPKMYRIKLLGQTPLPGGRQGQAGDEVLVPKYAVRLSA